MSLKLRARQAAEAVRESVAEITATPPPARSRSNKALPTVLAAAAMVLALVVLWPTDSDDTQVTSGDGGLRPVVPEYVPEGILIDAVGLLPNSDPSRSVSISIYGDTGAPTEDQFRERDLMVVVQAPPEGGSRATLQPPQPPPPDEGSITLADGTPARFAQGRAPNRPSDLSWDRADGASVGLVSHSLERAALIGIADDIEFTDGGRSARVRNLPPGLELHTMQRDWTYASFGAPTPVRSTASGFALAYGAGDPTRVIRIFTFEGGSAELVFFRAQAGPNLRTTELGGRRTLINADPESGSVSGIIQLAWQEAGGVITTIEAIGVPLSELQRVAESLTALSEAAWNRLHPEFAPPPAGSTTLAEGSVESSRWRLVRGGGRLCLELKGDVGEGGACGPGLESPLPPDEGSLNASFLSGVAWGRASTEVESVIVEVQNGHRVEAKIAGSDLDLPSRAWGAALAAGETPVIAIGFDAQGREVARTTFSMSQAGAWSQ